MLLNKKDTKQKVKLGRPPGSRALYRIAKQACINYTPKMRLQLIKAICKTYIDEACTIVSACKSHGISYTQFNHWYNKYPELKLIYDNYKLQLLDINKDRLIMLALRVQKTRLLSYLTLLQLLRTLSSIIDLHGNTTKTVIRKTKKRVLPTTRDIELVLKNLLKDFKDKIDTLDDGYGDDLVLTHAGIQPNLLSDELNNEQ